MTNIQPATDSEVGAIKRHLDEHGSIPPAYVLGLIARVWQDQAERDALAAQVAALVAWCLHVGAPVTSEQSYGAAARYLAADRFARAWWVHNETKASAETKAKLDEAYDRWRKM